MNCSRWESQIALYVNGDLVASRIARLESHMSQCCDCRETLAAFRLSQQAIQELRGEVVDVSRVHASVMERVRIIEAQRTWFDRFGIWLWSGFQWRYAVLGMIAVLVALGGFRLVSPTPARTSLVSVHQVPAAVLKEAKEIPAERILAPRRHLKPKPRTTEPIAESVTVEVPDTLVQLQTDDPNVVIYWLIERKGGH